jgi:hypothetical protein
MRNQFEKKKWNKMLRDKIQRKQNRPRYGKKNSKENGYYIWYKNKTKSNEKRMKLKKYLKKNLKQWKTNQKKEDYNWKTKCIRGQLWFLAGLAQISRSEKRKQGDEKKSQLLTNHWFQQHALPHKLCLHRTLKTKSRLGNFGHCSTSADSVHSLTRAVHGLVAFFNLWK